MKHFKRNIIVAILGMVFLGGFMGGNAWGISTDNFITNCKSGNALCTLTCESNTNKHGNSNLLEPHDDFKLYYKFNNGAVITDGHLDDYSTTNSNECRKKKNELLKSIEDFKKNNKEEEEKEKEDPEDDDDDVYNRQNGTYENNGGGIASILNFCVGDDGRTNIACIIDAVVFTFTTGVGVLGFTGIIIVGIQYLTAAGDAAKMTRAKRRMIEIVIGLVLYMFSYSLIRWLSPSYDGTQTIESQLNSQVETVEVGANK